MPERELYAPVRDWLRNELTRRLGRGSNIRTAVGADRHLCHVLEEWGVADAFYGSPTFEIRVDVVGCASAPRGRPLLFLVEVKYAPANLSALAQLLGYCRIVRPEAAWLLSPKGWSRSLARLVRDFGRADLLEFAQGKKITVSKWDQSRATVRPGDAL